MNKAFCEMHLSSPMIKALIVFIFLAGAIFRYKTNIHNSMEEMPLYWSGISDQFNGAVYSVGQISRQIEKYLYVKVPEDASDLYCAIDGNFFRNYYAALTLPTEEACKNFLNNQLGVPLEKFKKSLVLPKAFNNKGPDSWSQNLKVNWDLESYREFYIYEDPGKGKQAVVYVPGYQRIFIYNH